MDITLGHGEDLISMRSQLLNKFIIIFDLDLQWPSGLIGNLCCHIHTIRNHSVKCE